jgi:hypothetical protein
MDIWLERLERQLAASMPKEAKSDLPSLRDLYQWVDELVIGADNIFSADMARDNCMTWKCALQTQSALIAAFTVGRFVPPVRISIIRSLLHPESVGVGIGQGRNWRSCIDKDCRSPSTCKGNRFEIVEARPDRHGDLRHINFVAPHHKNDRRGFEEIKFRLPDSAPITRLLLRHIEGGHALLTQGRGGEAHLFVSRPGAAFTSATFTQQWKTLLQSARSIAYFCPSLARTAFVTEYTSTSGLDAEMWDGAATVMGNTVKMWNKEYNPRKRIREAQAAVDSHESFVDRLFMSPDY